MADLGKDWGKDWLNDFLDYSTGGESPPRYMFWVGVGTIAGVLRRKVWIDQVHFQWTPNFYVLLVGPPGGPKKTTSINIGLNLLKRVEGIDLGPQITTWQQLVGHMADAKQSFGPEDNKFKVDGVEFEASCCTIAISEFGTFFDPLNRELTDNLTDMWDGKLGTIRKETRTMGTDEIVNPFLNIMAGTTPGWINMNFSTKLIMSGFASRLVYVYEERPVKDVAYITREKIDRRTKLKMADDLVERLKVFAEVAGEFKMSEEAYVWGEKWYSDYRNKQRGMANQLEAGFYERQQTHLHKLAMVLCVSRGGFPHIEVEDMIRADEAIKSLEPDVKEVFGRVGQTRIATAAGELVEVMRKLRKVSKSALFRRFFFQNMSTEEFDLAVDSAKAAGYIVFVSAGIDPVIEFKEPKDD